MMDPADLAMLDDVRASLANPFRDPVRVGGVLVPRSLARQIERVLLRLRVLERRSAVAPHRRDAGASGAAVPFHHASGDNCAAQ